LGVTCNNGDIRVQMNTEVDDTTIATLKNSTFITGGSHWGCTFSDGKGQSQHIIQRRIKELAVSGNEVKMKTTKASYQEMFERAELSFSTSYLPNATILHAASPDPAHRELFEQQRAMFEAANTKVNQQGRKMLSFWHSLGSFFSKAWNGVKTVASDVAKVVKSIPKAIKAIATGDYEYDHALTLAQIQWNYDETTKAAKQRDIKMNERASCTECYANFEVSLNVDLKIESFSLKYAAAYLEGQAALHINATTDVSAEAEASFDMILATIQLPTVKFSIGPVPFVINTTIPIHGGADIQLQSKAGGTIQALAHLDGDVKYGVQYTPDNGMQFIHTHSFSHYGGLSAMHLELTAVAKVYVMPVIVIVIDHIGGPNVGFKGFVQSSLDYKQDGSMCSPTGGTGLSYTTAWGLQLTLGAQLDISFAGHTFLHKETDPQPIWSHQWPLTAGCLALPSIMTHAVERNLIKQNTPDGRYDFFEGVQYVGDITVKDDPSCDHLVSIHGGLQFVNSSENGLPGWVGVSLNNNGRTSSLTDYNIGCVGQNYYVADGPKLQYYVQPALEPSVVYVNCTLGMLNHAGITLASLEGTWSLSEDFGTMSINPENTCILPMTLKREKQSEGTTLARAGPEPDLDLVWDGLRHTSPAHNLTQTPQLTTAEATALLQGFRKFK